LGCWEEGKVGEEGEFGEDKVIGGIDEEEIRGMGELDGEKTRGGQDGEKTVEGGQECVEPAEE